MKKLFTILIVFLVWQCQPSQLTKNSKLVYIYDSKNLFESSINSNDSVKYSSYDVVKPVYKYVDSFLVAKNFKYYSLWHYSKYKNYKDTSFVKHNSYLDSIQFFDNNWLANEEKLDSFWSQSSCWKCGGIYDSSEIYLILPKKNTDSLIFRQVHRWFHQTQ